jgi:hypothetical protein
MNGVTRFPGGRRLGQNASFGVLVLANVLLMASTSAPSPIYPLYLQRWGFSVTILTVVFAVYVAGLVAALLTVGSLSDHLGRRPVLVGSLLVAAVGTAIFWAAGGVFSLVLARVVQGIATGIDVYWEEGWTSKRQGIYRLVKRGDHEAHNVKATVTFDKNEELVKAVPIIADDQTQILFRFGSDAYDRDRAAINQAISAKSMTVPMSMHVVKVRIEWTTKLGRPQLYENTSPASLVRLPGH